MIVFWAVSSPLCGALSDRLGRRKPIYLAGCILAAIGWSAMFYIPHLSLAAFVMLAAFTSMCSGAVVLGFAYSKESVPAQYLGTISGTTNIGNMIGPTLAAAADWLGARPALVWTVQSRCPHLRCARLSTRLPVHGGLARPVEHAAQFYAGNLLLAADRVNIRL